MEKTDKVINFLRLFFSAISIIAFNLNCGDISIKQRIIVSVGIFIIYVVASLFLVIAASITANGSDRYDKTKSGSEMVEKKERRFIIIGFSVLFLIDFIYININGFPLFLLMIGATWDSTPQYP